MPERAVQVGPEILLELQSFAIIAGLGAVIAAVVYFIPPVPKLLPLQRLRPVGWSGREVVLAFLLLALAPALVRDFFYMINFDPGGTAVRKEPQAGQGVKAEDDKEVADAKKKEENQRREIEVIRLGVWAGPLSTLLYLVLVFWLLFAMSRTQPCHVGATPARWRANIAVGYLGFLVVGPIVLGVFLAILGFFKSLDWPIETHAFEQLARQELVPLEWVLLFFLAVVGAPIQEELLFRGLLLGWLSKVDWRGHVTLMIVISLAVGLPFLAWSATEEGEPLPSLGPPALVGVACVGYLVLLRRSHLQFARDLEREMDRPPAISAEDPIEGAIRELEEEENRIVSLWRRRSAPLAIFGSALLFAVIHSAWPAPLALFPLGLALGWLSYRTQSLVGPLVLHALFNAVATVQLVLNS